MSGKTNESKTDFKKVFVVVAIFLCFIIIVAAMMYYQIQSKNQTSSQDQAQEQTPTHDKQKTRREFIVEVTSSNGHRCGISVEDENGEELCFMHFESDVGATVTKEFKIEAGVGDTVNAEVLCPFESDYALVKLVKESALFRHTIAYASDFDRVVFRCTIKEDDM